jgi:glutathione S-transferase
MVSRLVLVSHQLCPYVQRAAIVLTEKELPFDRIDIDLANKPDWFLQVSPLGKTPVLLVAGEPIFESSVICEYLDDTILPALHPTDALSRARHRAWMEFGSAVLSTIANFYNAPDMPALERKAAELRSRFEQLEAALAAGPYFGGSHFSMVDAVFAPIFRYFDVFDGIADFGVLADLPRLQAWREALASRASVRSAVHPEYPSRLRFFIAGRGAALSALMDGAREAQQRSASSA